MANSRESLSSSCPPIILGSATFNNQYNSKTEDLPVNEIVRLALTSGIRAFDTSPYYGPAELLLGAALTSPAIKDNFPRASYMISTKAGRISANEFNYSPSWVRKSVMRSCHRLGTDYLDVVFMHDIEFVPRDQMLEAVRELRRLRDEGRIRYVGVSGYPVPVLVEAAELVLRETGEPLDVVQNYGNFSIQNKTLGKDHWIKRFKAARISVLWNASLLGMGLLRRGGVPIGGMGDWHPAPVGLREKVRAGADITSHDGMEIEELALEWALTAWATSNTGLEGQDGLGVSVLGVSTVGELEQTLALWQRVRESINAHRVSSQEQQDQGWVRYKDLSDRVAQLRIHLGEWKDYAWPSPDHLWKNMYTAAD